MSDTYQAVYDATRSRISSCDVGEAVRDALRTAFGMVDHHLACIAQDYCTAAQEQARPSAIYKPTLTRDGDQFCAMYGNDLVNGCSGFGRTPAAAMSDFDTNWQKAIPLQVTNHRALLAAQGFAKGLKAIPDGGGK